ncbi:MBL fold metallo-hydrolase [Candidatus Woesearchaeota archaeon]|nr:MBL fold metallo-hydrolase [Candidatus Woesearchaeota archaeon]
MELTFLGTSTMAPTKDRNNTAIYLQTEKYGILFDCAEGTQRQFKIGKINFNKLDFILISHHHGDHTLGICGLIQTLATNNYKKKLTIFGPKDTKKYIKNAMNSCIFTSKIDLDIIEISNGKIFENENIVIES